ncbi:endonuclease III [Sphingoaurantiacus capsulatus]|uniref:Endonuclease III n=1 Tax=Sphingoaurantiacus capsulatus TaxID=1771310 RepID=A0ABV7XE85_9SPHN
MPPTRARRPRSRLSKDEIEDFFARLTEAIPDPKSDLEYSNAYTLLVAVVLSAQATDAGVNRATRKLFEEVLNPQAMIDLGEERLREHIKTIGLFNTKAKNVIALSEALIQLHGGQVPDNREALEALPGVGRKTANVVLNIAFGHDTCAVDTHIFRVCNRTGLAPGKDVRQVEDVLIAVIPKPYRHPAHHLLILHGRYTCMARKPHCWRCPVIDICRFEPKNVNPG